MTLGQLAQELEKSANSLANTLRQVGLADRLLHESNIITRDQETRLRNGNSKKIYNRVSSQPSGNTVYPVNSIGAWSKKTESPTSRYDKHCQNESFDGRH